MLLPQVRTVVRFSDSECSLADPAEDVRGRAVLDACGDLIGRIDDLLVDEEKCRLRFISVLPGGPLGMGSRRVLIPVEAITRVSNDSVRIDRDAYQVTAAPGDEPYPLNDEHLRKLYDYYGYPPYWTEDHAYVNLPFHY